MHATLFGALRGVSHMGLHGLLGCCRVWAALCRMLVQQCRGSVSRAGIQE